MRIKKVIGAVGIISLLVVGFSGVLFAQGNATPQQIIQKVRDAVQALEKSKGANLADFNNPKGPWVFQDTYVYVMDCKKGTMAAHPFAPKLIGSNIFGQRDVKGNALGAELCEAGKKPGGAWVEYWFPKPGEKTPSRKVGFALQAPGTPYVASAGIYSDKLSVAELDKMVK